MNIKSIRSFSFEEIRNKLLQWIITKPEINPRWKDFLIGGAGSNLIELAAAIGSFLAFSAYMNRQDSLLDHTNLSSSGISIGGTIGYNFNRKVATKIRTSFTTEQNILWRRDTPIGTYKSTDLVLLKDTQIKPGLNVIDVVAGQWKTHNYIITDNSDFISIPIEGVLDNKHYEIYVDGKLVDVTLQAEEWPSTAVLLRSYQTGIFVIFGNGQIGMKAPPAGSLSIKYIEPVILDQVETDKVKLLLNSEIVNTEVVESGSKEDSLKKIQALAPGYSGTRRLLISIDDYQYIVGAYEGNISGNAKPVPDRCCASYVTYLRDDLRLFTPEEELAFVKYLNKHALMGTEFIIVEPKPINVSVSLKILAKQDSNIEQIKKQLLDKLETQTKKLGGQFTMSILNNLDIPELLRIYIESPISDWTAKYNEYFLIKNFNVEVLSEGSTISKVLSFGTDVGKGYD